jgi:hypothetical protein
MIFFCGSVYFGQLISLFFLCGSPSPQRISTLMQVSSVGRGNFNFSFFQSRSLAEPLTTSRGTLGSLGTPVEKLWSRAVVSELFNIVGQLLASALVAAHIESSLAIYYTQVALTIKTTLQNKLNLC